MIVEWRSVVCGKVAIEITRYVSPLITLAYTACSEGVSRNAICTNCFTQLCAINSGIRWNAQILNKDSAMLHPLDVHLTLESTETTINLVSREKSLATLYKVTKKLLSFMECYNFILQGIYTSIYCPMTKNLT